MSEIERTLHLTDLNIKSIEYTKRKNRKSGNVENTLNPLKGHIECLKCGVVLSGTELLFYDALGDSNDNKENWLTVDEAEKKERMNENKKESENVKKQIDEVEEDLKEHAEEIEARYESIEEKKLLIQSKLSVIKEKEEKLNKLQERQRLLAEQKRLHFDGSGKHESKESLQDKWQHAYGAMEQCLTAIETLNEHKLLLESEQKSLQEISQRLEEKLWSLKIKEKKSFKRNQVQERLKSVIDYLTSLSGLSITNVTKNSVTIEIQDVHRDREDYSDDGETAVENRPSMLLTLQFAIVDGQFIVEDVQTNSLIFFIKDIIEQVKLTCRWRFFVLQVQNRFHNQAKLLKEMEILQERFAIDWNDEKQSVRVMLGKSGEIVCTLKVHDGYPVAGSISVEEIYGADPSILSHDRLMTDELKSLTEWIEYIFIKYSLS